MKGFASRVGATSEPRSPRPPIPTELEPFDLGIVATKANGLEPRPRPSPAAFPDALVMTTLNGLGAEEVVRARGDWPILSSVTFMSGTRHSDTDIEYVLDTATWIGPGRGRTPLGPSQEVAG